MPELGEYHSNPRGVCLFDSQSPERFRVANGAVERLVLLSDGRRATSVMSQTQAIDSLVSASYADQLWLRGQSEPSPVTSGQAVRVVDLFSGFGGLSIGIREAARAVGRPFEPLLAVDFEPHAAAVYADNFPGAEVLAEDLMNVFDSPVGSALSTRELMLRKRHSGVEILAGGPPCQGHSNLNNRTRHVDEKNELYRTMVRAAEVLSPRHILIENVPGALHDRSGVVQRTADELTNIGYNVSLGVIDMSELGVPQRRKRLVMMASTESTVVPSDVANRFAQDARSVKWAIGDLESITPEVRSSMSIIDEVARSNSSTRSRIDYLFDNELHDLPDAQRPPCHASGGHSYKSVYGRMDWNAPAQTITTGFYSMCMGRYVHPSERRTLTAREAARLQYVPDWFSFDSAPNRTSLARMIGNAVPSKLSYAVALEWLR